ncbi:MAG: hypothetical protein HY985_02975 [Magnetospirillum sp.]|nr:hypothetical protein [Magnetospirillum sp.]
MAMRPEERAEIAREILRRHLRPGQTIMQGASALKRLEGDRRIGTLIEARLFLKALVDLGEVECTWVDRQGPIGLVTLKLAPPPMSAAEAEWRARVSDLLNTRADVRPGDEAALGDLWPKLADWPSWCADDLIADLYDFRTRLEAGEYTGKSAYLFSASGRLASSKLLSLLPKPALMAFGIDTTLLSDPPPYVIVAGPSEPQAVVLVENPEAFEMAVAATTDLPVAWVSTYGFGIAHVDGAGARMAAAVTSLVAPIPLVRAGSPPPLDQLLAHPRLFHWGDLDLAGLLIFRSMQVARPQLRLSALYQPMIALLQSGGGHPYVEATGKPKQDRWTSDDPLISELLTVCATRAVDQELVGVAAIRTLALEEF